MVELPQRPRLFVDSSAGSQQQGCCHPTLAQGLHGLAPVLQRRPFSSDAESFSAITSTIVPSTRSRNDPALGLLVAAFRLVGALVHRVVLPRCNKPVASVSPRLFSKDEPF